MTWTVKRIVSFLLESAGDDDYVIREFVTAWKELRRACPTGNLRIRLEAAPEDDTIDRRNE